MNLGDFLQEATHKLQLAGIETARLDCLVLLEDTLKLDKARLLAHPEIILSALDLQNLTAKIEKRTDHTPLAYIRGKASFYGREFIVNQHVLVPRPETETMIDMLKSLPLGAHPHIADIGTGSGCIAITAALELPAAYIGAFDISSKALEVANSNARSLDVSIATYKSNLLQAMTTNCDVLLANLPYVPTNYTVNEAARHEPKLALFAGEDGLRDYRELWQQIAKLATSPQFVLTEALPSQHDALASFARSAGYTLLKTDDFIQGFQKQ